MTPEARRHFKRNFLLGVANGALVNFGLAFIEPFTVLPVFISRLGGSNMLIGLAAAIYSAGWFLPQAFVARAVQSRARVLGIYTRMSVVRVAAYAGATLVVLHVDPARQGWVLAGVIVFFSLATLSAGVAGLPFLEVTSKSIPVTSRGAFFGARRLVGGALGVLAGVVVAVVLEGGAESPLASGVVYETVERVASAAGLTGRPFPGEYATLFVLGAVFSALGFGVFAFTREAAATSVRETVPLGAHIREGLALLRREPNFRLFFAVRGCWQLVAMAFPFYAAYAYTELGFSESSVGLFVSVWVGSGVLSNYVWGILADRRGNRVVLVTTAVVGLFAPLVILLIPPGAGASGANLWVVTGTFLLNGFARSGRFISNMTYLLEEAPEDRRPVHVGFMNTLSFPFMLSPILGGVVVRLFSFHALFAASAVFALASVLLSARLTEPRERSLKSAAIET
jgi:predicted MFS family arabinose efflux permease